MFFPNTVPSQRMAKISNAFQTCNKTFDRLSYSGAQVRDHSGSLQNTLYCSTEWERQVPGKGSHFLSWNRALVNDVSFYPDPIYSPVQVPRARWCIHLITSHIKPYSTCSQHVQTTFTVASPPPCNYCFGSHLLAILSEKGLARSASSPLSRHAGGPTTTPNPTHYRIDYGTLSQGVSLIPLVDIVPSFSFPSYNITFLAGYTAFFARSTKKDNRGLSSSKDY